MVLEGRVLKGMLDPEKDEVTDVWRKCHNEAFRHLYASLDLVRVTKLKMMKRHL
jgi:hypothetical protein